jgi:hypothetical protein
LKGENGCKPIKEWQDLFARMYSKSDSNRTPEQMWIAVMAHSSTIGENIRKVAFEGLLKSAAHTFCWLCSFVNKCYSLQKNDVFSISESLCGIVSLKYPNRCGLCTHLPCDCDPVKMEEEKNKSARYRLLLKKRKRDLKAYERYTIEDYKSMFYDIYFGRLHIQTLENIGFHFLEEIGEAAVSIRQLGQLRNIAVDKSTGVDSAFLERLTTVEEIVQNYDKYHKEEIDYSSRETDLLKARVVNAKMDFVAEIGDSFSWFCAILNKLDYISKYMFEDSEKHKDILPDLDEILTKEYFSSEGKPRCPSCGKDPCECAFYNLDCRKIT